ncbi:MAG: glutamate-cysteine ligase family protein [Polyangiaceae bacterium]|nr:glutamate-cysteine ligase family protein [Polyangiaceae bacterium]
MVISPGQDEKPISSYDELLSPFHAAIKPPSAFRCGAEMEKFGVLSNGVPIGYEGSHGVRALMEELAANKGWVQETESEGSPLIALLRNGASITLEPGSQFELSGTAFDNCHQIRDELEEHLAELGPFSERHGIRWLGVGFHPFARRGDYTSIVPKQRYSIMREYLPTRGSHALDMMLRTATVQANYDYSSEQDAMTKMRVALRLSPLTTAIFANSPFYEGMPFGGKSYRAKIWLDTDPDRSGLVPALWKKSATFVDYVEWALDVPMFMFLRNGQKVANTGQTFRSFWKSGFRNHRPTLFDWLTHLNTLFPEVRLKKTIEVRGADSQSIELSCALPALYTGIFNDARALAEADAFTQDWTLDEVTALRKEVWQKGLFARFRAGTLVPLAERLIEIAEGGLERRAILSLVGKDERVHLAPLKDLVSHGQTPADRLIEGLDRAADMRAEILVRTDLIGRSV